MDERKPTRPRSPAGPPPARPTAPHAGANPRNEWVPDPLDVRRHARIMRERERVGPLGKLVRITAVVLLLAGAGLVYWNFDTLRGIKVDLSGLTELWAQRTDRGDNTSTPNGAATQTAVVAATEVAGAAAETSLSSERPVARNAETSAPKPAASAPPSAETTVAVAEPAEPRAAAPPPPAAPAPPPGPESFSFGLDKIEVSESNASADLLILRSGDMRRPSVVTWWTSDGTAVAGQDYASLGRVVVKFAPNEQNRGIHIPIIGDRTVEGPENFYVNLAPGDDATGEATERVEVVIRDDD
jgi:hypothetical protein